MSCQGYSLLSIRRLFSDLLLCLLQAFCLNLYQSVLTKQFSRDKMMHPYMTSLLSHMLFDEGIPLYVFPSFIFFTNSVPSVHVLLNPFVFLIWSSYFEQTTHLIRFTLPSTISKISSLQFNISCHFLTVFKFTMILK